MGQCRRRNLDYKLTCDFCSIRNAKEGVKDEDKTVAHYFEEVSRSAAERCFLEREKVGVPSVYLVGKLQFW